MSRSVEAIGIYEASGRGDWPLIMGLSYSENDPDEQFPIYSKALQVSDDEIAIPSLYPLEITADQAHEMNFRMKRIRASGVGTFDRHYRLDNNPETFPDDEKKLNSWPGVSIFDDGSGSAPERPQFGLSIGFPANFGIQGPAAGQTNYIYRPNGSAFPVPCDTTLYMTQLVGSVDRTISFPAACIFRQRMVQPFFLLQLQYLSGDGLNVSYSSYPGWGGDGITVTNSGFNINVFDWGSVPLYIYYFDGNLPDDLPVTDDIDITCTEYFGYNGVWDTSTGLQLIRPVPKTMNL